MKLHRSLTTLLAMACVLLGASNYAPPAFGQDDMSSAIESYWVAGNGYNGHAGNGTLPSVTVGSAVIQKAPGSRAITGSGMFRLWHNGVLISQTGVPAVAPVRS